MMEMLSVYYSGPCLLFPTSSSCTLNMRFVSPNCKSRRSRHYVSIRRTRLVCSNSSMMVQWAYTKKNGSDSLQGETSGSLGSDQYVSYLGEGYKNTTIDDSIKKIKIPGLPPQGLNGDSGFPITSCFWEWKPKLRVHYEKSKHFCNSHYVAKYIGSLIFQISVHVIGEPVYVVGNSLGGFVALYFATCNPQLVKGVTFSPRLARLFPWASTFALPVGVRKFISFLWQKIRDPRSIAEILQQVYVDHSTNVDTVFSRIIETTEHPAAAASFASIKDPWVMPMWGSQVKRKVPEAPYYQITPAGHCPHDEVPEVRPQGSVAMPLLDDPDSAEYGFSRDLEFAREGLHRAVMLRVVGTKSSIWNQISTIFKSPTVNPGVSEIR
ncbi:hypothetical protein MKW94_025329 [Papaver nudicaule]|uniref:AB hydrolase-1 domain-containing protein n=1 Tax=Papaver nudicaule TaxID=74823 RepID=A0AA41VP14_PAPNU|nr:hypothetical protein [Papaver nudicaule]